MDIQFYRSLSLPNTISKTLTSVATFPAAQLPTETDDGSISIRVATDAQTIGPTLVNYMRVNSTYYYVDSVTMVANGLSVVHGRIDVLMTYADKIRSLKVLGNRSTSAGQPALIDGLRRYSAKKTRTVFPFPNQIPEEENLGSYILATAQEKYST